MLPIDDDQEPVQQPSSRRRVCLWQELSVDARVGLRGVRRRPTSSFERHGGIKKATVSNEAPIRTIGCGCLGSMHHFVRSSALCLHLLTRRRASLFPQHNWLSLPHIRHRCESMFWRIYSHRQSSSSLGYSSLSPRPSSVTSC